MHLYLTVPKRNPNRFISGQYFDSWIIPVLLGSPGKWHPVLAQALACLLGSLEHLLSVLQSETDEQKTQNQSKREKANTERWAGKHAAAFLVCIFEVR